MFIRRPFIIAVFVTFTIVLLLTACDLGLSRQPDATAAVDTPSATSETSATANAATSPPATPRPAADVPQGGTLSVRLAAPVKRLTPWDIKSRGEEQVVDVVYNGLMRMDAKRQPQPDLAERFEVAPNGGVVTFTLRTDVRWHDGKPLTSDDVAWTMNTLRTLTPTNALLYDLQSTIGEIRTPISGTVVVSLTKAYAPLLASLTVPILPRHLLQTRTPDQLAALNFLQQPVGSGPFKLATFNAQNVAFVRNDEYFRARPNLERITLQVLDDNAAQNALSTGELMAAEFPTATTTLTLTGRMRADAYAENGSYWLAYNTRTGRVFADPQVRTALAQVLGVGAIVEEAVGASGTPLATSVLPGTWADPNLPVPNGSVQAANQALDAAGWAVDPQTQVRAKNGVQLRAQLFVRGDDARRVTAANAIATAAKALNIDLVVVPSDFTTTVVAKLAPPYDFDVLLGSWVNSPNTAGFPSNRFYDPDDSPLFSSDRIYGGEGDTRTGLRNIGGYNSPEYDRFAQAQLATYDPVARAAAIKSGQEVILRDQPYTFLWTNRIPVVLSTRIKQVGGDVAINTPSYLGNVEQWYLTP